MADVTPGAGRLLRTPGRPEPPGPPRQHQQQQPPRSESLPASLQRSPVVSVSASGRCSHGAASAAVHALHYCPTVVPEAISLELEAWPSEPSSPSTTTNDGDSSECDSTIPTLRRRFSHSSLGRLRGHTRANSVDSTTTDSSVTSSLSTSSTRSRWNIFAPVLDELTASNHRSNYAFDKRSRQARELWREYW